MANYCRAVTKSPRGTTVGNVGDPVCMERGIRLLTSRSSVRSPAHPSRPIPGCRVGSIAFDPGRPPRDPHRPHPVAYHSSLNSSTTRAARRPPPGKTCASSSRRPCSAPRRLWRPIPGPRALSSFLQATRRRQGRHSSYPTIETLHLTSRCASCTAAETWTPSSRRRRADHSRRATATGPEGFPATFSSPPRLLQMSSRLPTATSYTGSPPFRPTCPLRRTAKAVCGQPRPPPMPASWGELWRDDIWRRLSALPTHIFYSYLITQPVGSCLRKMWNN